MGISITKYEDSDGNVKFDVSKFDYYYTDDTFDTETADDFTNIITEQGDFFYVIKQTDTLDGQGKVTAVSETEKRIYGYMRDITKRDRKVADIGLAVTGNRILYVKPKYYVYSGGAVTEEWEIEEGDILKDRNNEKWRVIQVIHEPYINETKIYKKVVVRNIGLAS